MKVNVSEPKPWEKILEIEIDEQEIAKKEKEKIDKYRKSISLPGFRKGKATPSIIKSKYGKVIKAEVIEKLIQESYQKACKDNNIIPVSETKIDNLKAEDNSPITFRAEVEVDPEIEIKNYNKLKIKPSVKNITKKEIDEVIEKLREQRAEVVEVDRASKKGDLLSIEYQKVILDGEEKTDFKSPSQPVEIGSSKIKEFDENLTGKKTGSVVDLEVEFPDNYEIKETAGKKGSFKIKINKIQEKLLPELDDDFPKKAGDFKSMDELKDKIKSDLEKEELNRAKNAAHDKAVDKLIQNNPFDIPPSRIEQYIDYMLEESRKYRKDGITREEIAEKYRETGIKNLKRYRIIDYIAKKEKIKATQNEVDEQIQKIAQMYNQPFETLKSTFRKNGTTNRIRSDIAEQKTLDFLIGEFAPSEN